MSLLLQYFMMISFLFEPFQIYLLTLSTTKKLLIKSPFKANVYSVLRFYKMQWIPLCIFMGVTLFLGSQNPVIYAYSLYLLCLPFIIFYTHHMKQLLVLCLLPILAIVSSLHSLLFFFFIMCLFLFSKMTPEKPQYFIYEQAFNIFKILIPLVFGVTFFLSNLKAILLPQFITLALFIMIANLESSLTETKTLLETSKNRYMIWHLKSENFNLGFLNQKNRFTLYQQCFMILYLCGLMLFLIQDVVMVIIMILCFIYCLFAELDKMIQFKFFNQSILYDDLISRFIFSQVILSGLSFYLIYLGIEYVLNLRNITVPYFKHYQILFILWYGIWAVIFFKRFNKKLRLRFLKLSLVLGLLFISGCTQKEKESIVLVDERLSYTGNMIPEKTQTIHYTNDTQTYVKVEQAQKVKQGDVLITFVDGASQNEIKRLDFQLNQLQTKLSQKKDKLAKLEDPILKEEMKLQIENIQDEIKIIHFDKGLIQTTESIKADFSGIAVVENDTITIQSDVLVFSLSLNEHEYRLIKEIISFDIYNLNREKIQTVKQYDVMFKEDAYHLTFEPFEFDSYINQTLIISPSVPRMFVDARFIIEKDETFLAQTDATEVVVEVTFDPLKNGYYIIKGLKEGDVLYSYE